MVVKSNFQVSQKSYCLYSKRFQKKLNKLNKRDPQLGAILIEKTTAIANNESPNSMKPISGVPHVFRFAIDKGPGHRIYFARYEGKVYILDYGTKDSQTRDIKCLQKKFPDIPPFLV